MIFFSYWVVFSAISVQGIHDIVQSRITCLVSVQAPVTARNSNTVMKSFYHNSRRKCENIRSQTFIDLSKQTRIENSCFCVYSPSLTANATGRSPDSKLALRKSFALRYSVSVYANDDDSS